MDDQFEGKLDFKVSVIIPVYNADLYIEHAVVSAVNLDEVGEIILIEDGSIDNSLSICKELVDRFNKIYLFKPSYFFDTKMTLFLKGNFSNSKRSFESIM